MLECPSLGFELCLTPNGWKFRSSTNVALGPKGKGLDIRNTYSTRRVLLV